MISNVKLNSMLTVDIAKGFYTQSTTNEERYIDFDWIKTIGIWYFAFFDQFTIKNLFTPSVYWAGVTKRELAVL